MKSPILLSNMILMTMSMLIITFILTSLPNPHPIFIMINIIFYSLITCLNLSLWKPNYIYSIIIFLIIISGLLIIFLYFSSLVSNEQALLTPINPYTTITMMANLVLFIFYSLKTCPNYTYNIYKESSNLNNINEISYPNIMSLYAPPYSNITALSILFLLLALFIIIKMSSLNSKPMRKIK